MSVAALISGIIGIIMAILPFFPLTQMVGVVLGIIALTLATMAFRQRREQGQSTLETKVGVSLGAAAFGLSVLVFGVGYCGEKTLSEKGATYLGEEFKKQQGNPEFRAALEKARQAQQQLLQKNKKGSASSSPGHQEKK